jgi:hypothetical protein
MNAVQLLKIRQMLLSLAASALLLLTALVPTQVFATLAVGTNYIYGTSSPVILPSSVSPGQVIAIQIAANSGTFGTVTMTDNVNSGSYAATGAEFYDSTNTVVINWYWKVADATGTPTISISTTGGTPNKITAVVISGFVGTPTIDSAARSTFSATTAATTLVCSPIPATTATNEIYLMGAAVPAGSYWNSSSNPSWTAFEQFDSYAIGTSSGTNFSTTITWGATSVSDALVVGIYDAASSCTNSGYTSTGTIATPNGTTGSYVGKIGTFVDPNCSTIPYWGPSTGNFNTSLLLPMAPLGWIVRRRIALAKERPWKRDKSGLILPYKKVT